MIQTVYVEQFIRTGRTFQLILLTGMIIATYLSYYYAKKGKIWDIRPIDALDAMRESIGRCAEIGRPVLMTPGIGGLNNAQSLAGLTVLGEVAQQAAQIGVTCTTNSSNQQIVIASEAIIRNALTSAGKPELYEPGKYVRWFGGDQFSYAVGCSGHILDEKPGLVIFLGSFLMDTLVTGETASRVGAIAVGGTLGAIEFLAMMCQYIFIGDEMFAASASITRDPFVTGTIASQDWVKLTLIAVLCVGVILYAMGNNFIWSIMGI